MVYFLTIMPELDSRTWRCVHEYFICLETAQGARGLAELAVERIVDLVPADIGAIVLDPSLRIVSQARELDEMAAVFNARYRFRVPTARLERGGEMLGWEPQTRWRDYSDSEFYADFARPRRLGFGASTSSFHGGFTVALHRSSDGKPFTERDTAVLDVLNPHLDSMLSLKRKLATAPAGTMPEPQDLRFCFPRLSPRESQAGALLCAGAGAREIAASMLVGLRTAETHIAHLYDKLGAWSRIEAVSIMRAAWDPKLRMAERP